MMRGLCIPQGSKWMGSKSIEVLIIFSLYKILIIDYNSKVNSSYYLFYFCTFCYLDIAQNNCTDNKRYSMKSALRHKKLFLSLNRHLILWKYPRILFCNNNRHPYMRKENLLDMVRLNDNWLQINWSLYILKFSWNIF